MHQNNCLFMLIQNIWDSWCSTVHIKRYETGRIFEFGPWKPEFESEFEGLIFENGETPQKTSDFNDNQPNRFSMLENREPYFGCFNHLSIKNIEFCIFYLKQNSGCVFFSMVIVESGRPSRSREVSFERKLTILEPL